MTAISEVCPIIPCPFDAAGKVDFDDLANVIHWISARGAHGVTLFGIAGEYYKLTDQERTQIARTAVSAARDAHIPIIISITDHATLVAVERARQWQDLGAEKDRLQPTVHAAASTVAEVCHAASPSPPPPEHR